MELVDGCLEKTLENWASEKPGEFPGKECRNSRYIGIKVGLQSLHENVNLGATVSDGIVLTDHGPRPYQ